MVLTVEVALLSLCISIIFGDVGAVAKMSRSRAARFVAGVYTTLIRGVPDLVFSCCERNSSTSCV